MEMMLNVTPRSLYP